MKAYLSLGSNIEPRLFYLKKAKLLISKFCGKILTESDVIETLPLGFIYQAPFLNQVLLIDSYHPPFELMSMLLYIEKALGRKRRRRWGERTIDIDILLIPGVEVKTQFLQIPHHSVVSRDFVRKLLGQIGSSASEIG